MGMATDQFVADARCHSIQIETVVFLGDACMQHHLQQQVAELLL